MLSYTRKPAATFSFGILEERKVCCGRFKDALHVTCSLKTNMMILTCSVCYSVDKSFCISGVRNSGVVFLAVK